MNKHFSQEQIVHILCEADAGCPVEELGSRYGFSARRYRQWRAKVLGSESTLAQRLAHLEAENERLRQRDLIDELATALQALHAEREVRRAESEPIKWPVILGFNESQVLAPIEH